MLGEQEEQDGREEDLYTLVGRTHGGTTVPTFTSTNESLKTPLTALMRSSQWNGHVEPNPSDHCSRY